MNIIIVGAGIAGLSAGVGLRRAGHKVTVVILCPDSNARF
jgi:salicylate hydroxylase